MKRRIESYKYLLNDEQRPSARPGASSGRGSESTTGGIDDEQVFGSERFDVRGLFEVDRSKGEDREELLVVQEQIVSEGQAISFRRLSARVHAQEATCGHARATADGREQHVVNVAQ
jgi:hypothetical protein